MTRSDVPGGWTYPTPTARKVHYFPIETRRSLCGRYGIPFVPDVELRELLQPDTGTANPEDCAACRRALDAG